MKDAEYVCKHCKIKIRKKAVTDLMYDLRTCPQCYTKRAMEHAEREVMIEGDYVSWTCGTKSGKMHIRQAVKYLEHGAEMEEALKEAVATMINAAVAVEGAMPDTGIVLGEEGVKLDELLTKLEASK